VSGAPHSTKGQRITEYALAFRYDQLRKQCAVEHAMRGLWDRADDLRDALAVEVVGGYEEQRTEVRAALSEVRELPLEVTEIAGIVDDDGRGSMPDIAMVVFSGDEAVALRYLQMQFQRSTRPQLIALLPHRTPASIRRALHAGADDLLFFPVAVDDVTRAFSNGAKLGASSSRAGWRRFIRLRAWLGAVA